MEKKISNLEKSIAMLQKDHSQTLAALHAEIKELQRRNTDLVLQLTLKEAGLDAEVEECGVVYSANDISSQKKENEELKHKLDKLHRSNTHLKQKLFHKHANIQVKDNDGTKPVVDNVDQSSNSNISLDKIFTVEKLQTPIVAQGRTILPLSSHKKPAPDPSPFLTRSSQLSGAAGDQELNFKHESVFHHLRGTLEALPNRLEHPSILPPISSSHRFQEKTRISHADMESPECQLFSDSSTKLLPSSSCKVHKPVVDISRAPAKLHQPSTDMKSSYPIE